MCSISVEPKKPFVGKRLPEFSGVLIHKICGKVKLCLGTSELSISPGWASSSMGTCLRAEQFSITFPLCGFSAPKATVDLAEW